MKYGFDVSRYVPAPSQETFDAICYSERIQRAVLACDEQTIGEWLSLVQARNLELDVYLYLSNQSYFIEDIDNAAAILSQASLDRTKIATFWLDVEDESTPTPTFVQLSQAIAHVKQLNISADVGIYTRSSYWLGIGNPQLGTLCKLWTADYSANELFTFNVWFGGWVRASGIQFAGNYETFGVTLDMSVWDG